MCWLLSFLDPGPNLDKMCIWSLDAAPSHELLREIYFVVKPKKKKVWKGAGKILSALFLLKKKVPFFVIIRRCPNILD